MGDPPAGNPRLWATLVLVLGFWLLDASNNAIWVVSKALTSDVVPREQLTEAFSTATAVTGLGLALGYLAGGVDWGSLPGLGALRTNACKEAGGCADLRAAFLIAVLVCAFSNICTLLVGKEEPAPPMQHQLVPSIPRSAVQAGQTRGLQAPLVSQIGPQGQPGSAGASDYGSSGDSGAAAAPPLGHHALGEHPGKAVPSTQQSTATSTLLSDMRLLGVYVTTLLAWLGWISLQIYQTHFVATEVFRGSSNPNSPANGRYMDGVQAASRALIANALLMAATSCSLPLLRRCAGDRAIWSAANLLTAALLLLSVPLRRSGSPIAASLWLVPAAKTVPFSGRSTWAC